ncbi:hypothetical protein HK101_001966 [Irineochytrium annulatum]|nr:hypothetical protein HK101_001966 [Irineochytrium annulatum]
MFVILDITLIDFVVTRDPKTDGPPVFLGEAYERAIARAPRSSGGHLPHPNKIYRYELYRQILENNPSIFVLQVNNMTAPEYQLLKRDARSKGLITTAVRNGIFHAAIDDVGVERRLTDTPPPKGWFTMRHMFVGPCCIMFTNETLDDRPSLVKDILGIGEKFSKRVVVIGAMVGKAVWSCDQLKEVAKLPPMARLREEMVGVLSAPAAGIVSTLQQTPGMLVASLQQHVDAQAGGRKGEGET